MAEHAACRAPVENDPKRSPHALCGLAQPAFFTGGGDHVPSRIEGGLSFGQYILIIRMNWSAGAGSQFASETFAGFSCEN